MKANFFPNLVTSEKIEGPISCCLPMSPPFPFSIVIIFKLLPGDAKHLKDHHETPDGCAAPGHIVAVAAAGVFRPHGPWTTGQGSSHCRLEWTRPRTCNKQSSSTLSICHFQEMSSDVHPF